MVGTAPVAARGMGRRLVVLFAVACGASAANMYYAQPLLDLIAEDLGVSAGTAGLLVTASQVGFAAGLIVLVPLGDLMARHRLIGPLLGACSLTMLGAAAAPNFAVLAAAILLVGIAAVVVQILVPLAGTLAADHQRGTVLGAVMGGLLSGVLVARTAAGLLAAATGWRTVYVVAAGVCAVLGIVLHRALPRLPPAAPDLTYRALLRSLGPLLRDDAVLRRRMIYGALGMVGFTTVWTALAFLIASPAYGYGAAVTGLLSLAGLFGVAAAFGSGRLADRGWANQSTGVFLAVMVLGWVLLWIGGTHMSALIAGLILLDLGIQGQQILSQSLIYAQRPEARSRVTTLFMTSIFAAGAVSSVFSAVAWSVGGWNAVAALGTGFAVLGLLVWLQEQVARPKTRKAAGTVPAAGVQLGGPDGI